MPTEVRLVADYAGTGLTLRETHHALSAATIKVEQCALCRTNFDAAKTVNT